MKSNIVLTGIMGCGKTTVGKTLSDILNMPFIDIDKYIESQYGPISRIFEKGENHFREIESQAVSKVSEKENTIISTGGGVVLRPYNMERLKKNGIIFFINRPIEEIIKTIEISNRPMLKNKKENLYSVFKDREQLYVKYCDYIISVTDLKMCSLIISSVWNKKL